MLNGKFVLLPHSHSPWGGIYVEPRNGTVFIRLVDRIFKGCFNLFKYISSYRFFEEFNLLLEEVL